MASVEAGEVFGDFPELTDKQPTAVSGNASESPRLPLKVKEKIDSFLQTGGTVGWGTVTATAVASKCPIPIDRRWMYGSSWWLPPSYSSSTDFMLGRSADVTPEHETQVAYLPNTLIWPGLLLQWPILIPRWLAWTWRPFPNHQLEDGGIFRITTRSRIIATGNNKYKIENQRGIFF